MELTIEGIAFTFTHIEEAWSAAAVVDYINFTAADIKFSPLKTTTTRQIEALLKMPATLKRSDKCLLLAFYVEVLDQNVVVQLDRETLTENEELHVMIRKQQERIDQLEKGIAPIEHQISRINYLEKHIAPLEQRIVPLEKRIGSLEGQSKRIDQIGQKIAPLEKRIVPLEDRIIRIFPLEQRVDQLEKRIDRLDPKSVFFRTKIVVGPKGLSFETDRKEDEPHLQQFLSLWWRYLKDRYCYIRNSNFGVHTGCLLQYPVSTPSAAKIGDVFKDICDLMKRKNCFLRPNPSAEEWKLTDLVDRIPPSIASLYQMKMIISNNGGCCYGKVHDVWNSPLVLVSEYAGLGDLKKDKIIGFIQMRRRLLKHRFVPNDEIISFCAEEVHKTESYLTIGEWNENESLIIYRPELT